MSRFGWYKVPEPVENMGLFHLHDGVTPLKVVDHEPKNAVLDQENLVEQGIDVTQFIPGCTENVDALGSCTENAMTSALSNVLTEAEYFKFTGAKSYQDTKALEISAITNYHRVTDLTKDPSSEWPPTDCGSSGPFIVQLAQSQGIVKSQKIAHSVQSLCSLLQSGGVLTGKPFLNVWMEPNAAGFVDGNGSYATIQEQIQQGIAGGHETYISAIVKIVLDHAGNVVPEKTVLRERNSWTKSWGDQGSFLIHLSTYEVLMQYVDLRQIVA
jgi:hypothetical protein